MASGYIGNRNGKIDTNYWVQVGRKGLECRKEFAREQMWQMWRQAYRGVWRGDVLPSNLFFKMTRTIVPRVYFRDPHVAITPAKQGIENLIFSTLLEGVDNKMMRRMKIKTTIKTMVQHAFFFGTGIGKLGFGAEHTPDTTETLDVSAPTNRGRVEYDSRVEENLPFFLPVHPGSVIFPAEATSPFDRRWDIHWVRRAKDDVLDDNRLEGRQHLVGSSKSVVLQHGLDGATRFSFKKTPNMIDLWEVHDKKTGEVFIMPPFMRNNRSNDVPIMLRGIDEFQANGRMALKVLSFNEDDESIWGIPDLQILDPQQRELNEAKTQIMKHRRMSLVRILCEQGKVTEAEAQKFVSEHVMPVVFTKGPPDRVLKVIEGSNIPIDLFRFEDSILRDVREMIGFSRNEFGELSQGSRKNSATEVRAVSAASEIRVDERRDLVADLLVEVVEDMHQILFNHWGGEQVIDIMGPSGAKVWVAFKPEVLKDGRYEVTVDPDTSQPMTKEVRRQLGVAMFRELKGEPEIDNRRLIETFVRDVGGPRYTHLLKPINEPGLNPDNPVDVRELLNQATGGSSSSGSRNAFQVITGGAGANI